MLNNVTAVKAEELNDKVVSTSTVDESNKNNNAESTESLTKSSGSEDKLATGVNEQDSLNTQTTGEAVIANQEETNSDCVYLSDIDYIASQSKAGFRL